MLSRLMDEDFSLFMAVPTIYGNLSNHIRQEAKENNVQKDYLDKIRSRFCRYRLMVSGSAALPETQFHEWEHLSGQRLLERFGMTELGMALSNPYEVEGRIPGSVGKVLPGVTAAIQLENGTIDTHNDGHGELLIKSDAVFDRYLNKPEATAKEFY